ncbi:MAG: cytochrome c-type biogenesis protein CcmH [Armatimonadota bacterium]|nr:cytochrome c-type biogenesis protein CcmH [Armatimonadota bacterium]MDR7518585.1 cytochrome c-type biogenesis protein CcmH [Armatimonadota bacterium]MDR7549705.1 cytochrome c-type biogenesis protein CcmH [Armatimonadota bacterium]
MSAARPGAMVRGAVAAAICLSAALLALSAAAGTGLAAPTLEDQVHSIARDLMCPVCAGQTVAESNSQLAEQMRQIIRERLQAGQTREEIVAYFIAQFGEGVLAAPPPRGSGLVLWLSLPAALILGALILRRFLRTQKTAPRPTPPPPGPDEVQEIEQALRRLD